MKLSDIQSNQCGVCGTLLPPGGLVPEESAKVVSATGIEIETIPICVACLDQRQARAFWRTLGYSSKGDLGTYAAIAHMENSIVKAIHELTVVIYEKGR